LLAGEVDIIATPSPYSIPYLERSGMKIASSPVPTLYLIWVNHADPILKNPKVREALCMAMDRTNFVKSHRRGYARPAYGILNFGGPGYDPDYRDCTYDPAKAKALLAEAVARQLGQSAEDQTLGLAAAIAIPVVVVALPERLQHPLAGQHQRRRRCRPD